jgi:hypothetical protein
VTRSSPISTRATSVASRQERGRVEGEGRCRGAEEGRGRVPAELCAGPRQRPGSLLLGMPVQACLMSCAAALPSLLAASCPCSPLPQAPRSPPLLLPGGASRSSPPHLLGGAFGSDRGHWASDPHKERAAETAETPGICAPPVGLAVSHPILQGCFSWGRPAPYRRSNRILRWGRAAERSWRSGGALHSGRRPGPSGSLS